MKRLFIMVFTLFLCNLSLHGGRANNDQNRHSSLQTRRSDLDNRQRLLIQKRMQQQLNKELERLYATSSPALPIPQKKEKESKKEKMKSSSGGGLIDRLSAMTARFSPKKVKSKAKSKHLTKEEVTKNEDIQEEKIEKIIESPLSKNKSNEQDLFGTLHIQKRRTQTRSNLTNISKEMERLEQRKAELEEKKKSEEKQYHLIHAVMAAKKDLEEKQNQSME